MKPQEALERIKVYNEIYSKNLPCEMPMNEAFIMSVKALEKQIPKKPISHIVEPIEAPIKIGNANWCKGTTIYKCPCCNEFISRLYDYCYKCGQKLDWSDTE